MNRVNISHEIQWGGDVGMRDARRKAHKKNTVAYFWSV